MNLTRFLSMDNKEKRAKLLHCCYCRQWADDVLAVINKTCLESIEQLADIMRECWSATSESGYLEAFAAHPEIGDRTTLENKFATQAHAEQGQVAQASSDILDRLIAQNKRYSKKFGFIFIISATGKPAEEILVNLLDRINNTRADEIKNAAVEQEKIMLLRLYQMIQ